MVEQGADCSKSAPAVATAALRYMTDKGTSVACRRARASVFSIAHGTVCASQSTRRRGFACVLRALRAPGVFREDPRLGFPTGEPRPLGEPRPIHATSPMRRTRGGFGL